MPGYLVSFINITDPEKYKEYGRLAGPVLVKFGGKVLARGGERTVMEGSLNHARVVIVEFPSVEVARNFYNSPEYGAARAAREGAADFNMMITEGI